MKLNVELWIKKHEGSKLLKFVLYFETCIDTIFKYRWGEGR